MRWGRLNRVRAGPFGIAVVAAATLTGAAWRAEARAAAGWKIAPEPTWIAAAPVDTAARAPVDPSVLEYLLDDTQVRVTPAGVSRFRHVKLRPRSPGQVEEASQLELEFDPSHEHLIIHHAHVVRDGRPVSRLGPADVRVAQRERDLEQRIYDGTLTAVIFLPDVRVGDVIDYAFTFEGNDPLLGGKYVGTFSLADETFTAAWRQRILMPAGRALTIKNHGLEVAPRVTTMGDGREYLWERRDIAPMESEDEVPDWFDAQPWVDVSEFGSWAEIAALYERLAPPREPPGPAMTAELAKLRARPTDEARLLEAIRFVQDDIRYTGLESGLGGHKPFAPSTVLVRRFGDCKDKSALLVALLGELGFAARPVLVNTERGRGLDDLLPSPFAFDHAIVQVTAGGATYFVDPTLSYQRGSLAERQPPPYERALLIAPDTKGLVPIPRPPLREPSTSVRETFVVAPDGSSAELEVETTLRHDEADDMRERLSRRTKKEIARDYLNFYAEDDPTISQAGDLQVADDEQHNVIVMHERYHLGTFWKDSEHELGVTALAGHLKDPRIKLRHMPLALTFPLRVSHTTVVRLPTLRSIEPESVNLADDHLSFAFSSRIQGNDLVIDYDFQTLTDAVPPEKAQRFFALLAQVRDRAGYVLRRQAVVAAAATGHVEAAGAVALAALGMVVLGTLVASGVRARRRRVFQRQRGFSSGEAALTAIEVASEAELPRRVAALRCQCGSRYQPGPDHERQQVNYDGRTLTVLPARCPSCGHARSVFMSVRA